MRPALRTLRRRLGRLRRRAPVAEPWRSPRALVDAGAVTVGHRSYPRVPHVVHYPGDDFRVRIGAYTALAAGVELMPGGNHRTDSPASFPLHRKLGLPDPGRGGEPWSKGDIVVGNDVWIGRGAMVLGGVTIADGAVVAARAVVTHDVGPYEIVAGVPARPVGRRMGEAQAAAMQRIAWWDWPEERIVERVDELTGADVDGFIRRYGGP